MCKSFLCEVYTAELKDARKLLSKERKFKQWGKFPETIDLAVETAQQCVDTAQAKIDELHKLQQQEVSR